MKVIVKPSVPPLDRSLVSQLSITKKNELSGRNYCTHANLNTSQMNFRTIFDVPNIDAKQ